MIKILTEKETQRIIWTLLCLMPIVGMAVDLVAPSLPAIANSLQILPKLAKDLISIYLLGYAIGNFFTGFLADALGRRILLRTALLGFVVVSFIPTIFPNIAALLAVRFFQGITIGAVAVLARAIFADVLPTEKLVKLGTWIGTMWGLGPVIGPIIGSYLQVYFGWKAGFCFFSIISLLALVAVWLVVPETHTTPHPLKLKTVKHNLAQVLQHRMFMGLVVLMGLVYSLIIVFHTAGPFLIQQQLHYSPIFFGRVALCSGLMFLLATFVCRALLKKYAVEYLYKVALISLLSVVTLAFILSYFLSNSMALIIITSGCMFFTSGFIFPMSVGKGLSLFRPIAGTATAVMYLINTAITSLASFLVSFVTIQNTTELISIYFILLLASMSVYWLMVRQK